jgi:hypothetical protein
MAFSFFKFWPTFGVGILGLAHFFLGLVDFGRTGKDGIDILAHFFWVLAHFYFKTGPAETVAITGFEALWPTFPLFSLINCDKKIINIYR